MNTRLVLIDANSPSQTAYGNVLLESGQRVVHVTMASKEYTPRPGDTVLFAGECSRSKNLKRLRGLQDRSQGKPVPLLVLETSPEACGNDARLDAIRAGADDVINVSGQLEEFSLKIASYTRILNSARWEMEIGSLVIDLRNQLVRAGGEPIELTSTELRLLTVLAEKDGMPIKRETLLQEVWGYSHKSQTRTLDTHIKRLREKLGHFSGYIQTVRGLGYALSDTSALSPLETAA